MPEISAHTAPAPPATPPAEVSASSQDSSSNQPFDGVLQSRLGGKPGAQPVDESSTPATHKPTDAPVVAVDGKDLPPDIAALIAASQPVQVAPQAGAPAAGSVPDTVGTDTSLPLLRASLPAALAALRSRDQDVPHGAGAPSDTKTAAAANSTLSTPEPTTPWPGLGALLSEGASPKPGAAGTTTPTEGVSAKDISLLLAVARSLTSLAPRTTTLMASTSTTASTTTPPAVLSTPLPFAQPGWEQGLGNRVMWMVNQQVQTAELRMNPAHLGPLEVRISIRDDQATVSFVSAHAQVRDALQAAIPHLREMLSDSGLNLSNVNIAQHSFADARQRPDSPPSRQGGAQGEAGPGESHSETTLPLGRLGLIDYYA